MEFYLYEIILGYLEMMIFLIVLIFCDNEFIGVVGVDLILFVF